MGRRQGWARDGRIVLVGSLIVLAWLGLGYRLFRVQAVEATELTERGRNQRVRVEDLPAARGTIYDRDRVELAVTIDAATVVANPSQIQDAEVVARMLAPVLKIDVATLTEKLSGSGQFAYIARAIERNVADRIERLVEDFELTGISLTTEPKRVYPGGTLAAPLIGFVRADDQAGLEGIEFAFDTELTGVPGQQIVERAADGTPIPQADYLVEPAIPGSDLILTIDREIQYAAEQILEQALVDTSAAAGSVVVLDVDSGEILAMVNVPGFDANDRSEAPPEAYRNRAVADVYEPGSTLKVVTIAAALEEGVVSPGTTFDVPVELLIHDKTYTDVGREQEEEMNVAEIVARSSNIGTIMVQGELGNEAHFEYLQRFGLGSSPGTDLGGEASGQLHPLDDWCETTCGPSTAIGYRVDVTPLQMASVFATLANDGVWVQPHIVKEVFDGAGESVTPERVERPVLSAKTASTMRQLLRGVVETGTGWRAAVDGYTIGGKTGTTEKLIPGVGYSPTDRISSFIGIAPITAPEVVIAVVLDSPHGELPNPGGGEPYRLEFGGVSAAPIFAEVAEATLHQLGIAPNGS